MTEHKDFCLHGSEVREDAGSSTPRRWEPIDSAPKDGSDIIAVYEAAKGPRVTGAHWNTQRDCFYCDMGGIFPTHWMPLPQPPGVDGGDSGDAPRTEQAKQI